MWIIKHEEMINRSGLELRWIIIIDFIWVFFLMKTSEYFSFGSTFTKIQPITGPVAMATALRASLSCY